MNAEVEIKRILVVDDEDNVRNVICRSLKRVGYDVLGVSSGPEALHHNSKEHFDLLILDVRMPGMNGFEVLRAVKGEHPEILAIMLTGVADNELLEEESKAEGASALITKPCSLEELTNIVKSVFVADDRSIVSQST